MLNTPTISPRTTTVVATQQTTTEGAETSSIPSARLIRLPFLNLKVHPSQPLSMTANVSSGLRSPR
jgi:hypothetical protein